MNKAPLAPFAPGDPALESIEQQLARQPKITAPTIALAGADDGVDPPASPEEVGPPGSTRGRARNAATGFFALRDGLRALSVEPEAAER